MAVDRDADPGKISVPPQPLVLWTLVTAWGQHVGVFERLRLSRDFADFPGERGRPVPDPAPDNLGDAARTRPNLLLRLGIGKPAPEIVGVDLDGKPMKLSDYRGKVVVLDFCGRGLLETGAGGPAPNTVEIPRPPGGRSC